MSKSIAMEFVRRINSHNVEAIIALMSDDHTFIDAHGNSVNGKEKMRSGWKGYFEWFPDYHIDITSTLEQDNTVALFGTASGTFKKIAEKDAAWNLPASWKAVIENGKIKLWQVFADTKTPFDITQKYPRADQSNSTHKVQGFGGIFFKSNNLKTLARWYDEHLGTEFGNGESCGFKWREHDDPGRIGQTVFGLFKESTAYFRPSKKPFMLNFRVKNLEAFLKKLKSEGVHVEEKTEIYDYGKFGWILDPEGNKIEL